MGLHFSFSFFLTLCIQPVFDLVSGVSKMHLNVSFPAHLYCCSPDNHRPSRLCTYSMLCCLHSGFHGLRKNVNQFPHDSGASLWDVMWCDLRSTVTGSVFLFSIMSSLTSHYACSAYSHWRLRASALICSRASSKLLG